MIKVLSQTPSDLFFPDPTDGSKGVTLKKGPEVNVFDVAKLPPEVFKRFRIMAEDKHVLIETTEIIEPDGTLAAIHPSAQPTLAEPAEVKTSAPVVSGGSQQRR